MSKYQIMQTVSGVIVGTYEGQTEDAALDAMAQDAGYKDYEDLLSVTGETRDTDTLEVSPVTEPAMTFNGLTAEFGTYTKDGIDYAITQSPYADYVAGTSTAYVANGETYFFASGFDRAGNPVSLIWEITNKDADDDSDACDWDDFEVRPEPGRDVAPWHPDNL